MVGVDLMVLVGRAAMGGRAEVMVVGGRGAKEVKVGSNPSYPKLRI